MAEAVESGSISPAALRFLSRALTLSGVTTSAPNGSGVAEAEKSSATLRAASLDKAVRALESALVTRQTFARTVGTTFDGKRNVEETLGYEKDLTVADYRHRYERGDISERIVEAYPRATWSGGAAIVEDPDPGVETDFEVATAELFDRLDVWARLLRADILAGLGRYSVILIGADGALHQELPRLSGPDAIHYISTFAEDKAKIGRIVGENGGETDNPRYGLPEFYEVSLGASGHRQRVHWSRVIHVAEGTLEDDLYGKPRLRSAWNRLNDLVKIVGGGAEAAWRRMDPGLHIDMDPKAEVGEVEQAAQAEGIEEYIHGLARVIRTTGTKVNPLSATVAGFGPNADSILQLISAATGIPHRILTGSERGELASAQDRNNWNDRVGERRREFAVPLALAFLNRLIDRGALPEPEFYEVLWPEIDELDEGEKAEVAGKLAEANKANSEAGGGLLFTADEIRDDVYKKGPREEVEDPTPGVPGNLRRAADDAPRIVIVGGPRRGKSTLARSYREEGIPTYCGDPASLVKDPEFGVTYLPDGLEWSECSAYVAERWLTQPGPWCCEGVVMARALRKFLANGGDASGIDVVVIEAAHPDAEVTAGQEQFTKSVMTVWSEIAPHFPNARILRPVERDPPEPETEPRSAQLRRNKQVKRERKERRANKVSVRFYG